MRLLVSVRAAAEVAPALAGGADIIDAKEPARGSLGAVSPTRLREIAAAGAAERCRSAWRWGTSPPTPSRRMPCAGPWMSSIDSHGARRSI